MRQGVPRFAAKLMARGRHRSLHTSLMDSPEKIVVTLRILFGHNQGAGKGATLGRRKVSRVRSLSL